MGSYKFSTTTVYNAKLSYKGHKKKIDEKLEPFANNISKESNSQLLKMVYIFTVLAFLLFGGISSLENLFANSGMKTFKFMIFCFV
ncbi:MAG: hypothetical protein U0J50_01870 [Peptacetobacter hiranonis]|nr:hypothetical protein [Peptacetobacter hiranonis]